MPKRSLNPRGTTTRNDAKKIEQLNRAVDVLLARADGKPRSVKATSSRWCAWRPTCAICRAKNSRTRLKSELLEGRKTMSTIAEPVASVHTSATPRLTFKDAAKAIEFYKNAFGAKETYALRSWRKNPACRDHDWRLVVMLTEEWPEGGRFSPETLGNSPVMMSLSVPDVDKFFAHAIGAGAKTVIAHRRSVLRTPRGNASGSLRISVDCIHGERRDVGRRDAPAHGGDDERGYGEREAGGESDSARASAR